MIKGKIAGEFEIETRAGLFVDTANPDPATITVEDIAHALAHTCRYGGHCQQFYSVAEHALLVSRRLEQQGYGTTIVLAGLHHDDAEAYLGDIPRPMKPLLGTIYESLTENMEGAIVEALSLPFSADVFHDRLVKDADSWALLVEARHLLPSRGRNWSSSAYGRHVGARIVTPRFWQNGMHPVLARRAFLARHAELLDRLSRG